MKRRPNTPHDTFLKTLLELVGHAEALVRLVFHPAVGRPSSETPFERLPAELFGSELTPLAADALFLVRDEKDPGRDCIVGLEHKSWPDANVALQIIRYTCAVLDGYGAGVRAKGDGPSPRILFAVLYHGARGWNPGLPSTVITPAQGGDQTKVMDCVLVDLGKLDPSLLVDYPILRAGLGLMAMSGGGTPTRERLVDALRTVAADGVYRGHFLSYMVYALEVTEEELAAAYMEAVPEDRGGLEETMRTLANHWRSEGIREGELKGQSKMLLRLLGRRFGTVPDSVRKRVATASTAELGVWLDAVLDAKNVDAVFAAAPRN